MAYYTYGDVRRRELNPEWVPCKCCRLRDGSDLPVPKELNMKQIHELATSFSHSVFADWIKLNAILKRFEAVVRKRWLRKSIKQRREILLTARPNIPHVHRPDFFGLRDLGHLHVSRTVTCGAEAHLTPYINLEDLQQGHNLLLLIHSRGRHRPSVFASTDPGKAHLGHGWSSEPDPEGIAMLLLNEGSQTPRRYGALHPVSKLPPWIGHTHSVDPMYGLLTLEIQQGTYNFLLRCVQQILHDVHPTDFKLAPHRPVPPPLQKPEGVWDSVSQSTLEADYHLPREATLSRFKLLINGRRLAAEDHVCSLREDPGYFLEQLKEWREHHFLPKPSNFTPQLWRTMAAQICCNALDALHSWKWIADHLAAMRPLNKQVSAAIEHGTRLRANDEYLWVVLEETISHMLRKPMQNLKFMFPFSSGLRNTMQEPHMYGDCLDICVEGSEHGWHMKPNGTPSALRAVRIFHMLSGLDEHGLMLHGLRPVVQEAHYMLEHDVEVNKLIDNWLLTDFFELAVLADLQDRIDQFHPYTKTWTAENVAERPKAARRMDQYFARVGRIVESVRWGSICTTSLGNPLDGRFNYPSDKRRTAENVRELQSAEAALKTYWEELERGMRCFGVSLKSFLEEHLSKDPSQIHMTQDWKEEPVDLPTPSKAPSWTTIAHTAPPAPHLGNENKKTEIAPEERAKRKTHGKAREEEKTQIPSPQNAVHPIVGTRTPIRIPRRSFKVMSALLPSPSTISEAPREVSWDDFVHTLNNIGLVPEKLYGSVWIFKPLPEGEGLASVGRSIQFHEPKGVRRGNKIDLMMVRRFGDRLKRAFGWDGETFACA